MGIRGRADSQNQSVSQNWRISMKTGRGDEQWCYHDNRQAARASLALVSSGVWRAATETIRVFNLLNGKTWATFPDGILGRWVVVDRGLVWVGGGGYVAEGELWRGTTKSGIIWTSQLEMKMKKVVGVISFHFFFFVCFCNGLLPSRSNYKDMRGTNRLTHEEKHHYTHIQNTQNHKQMWKINQKISPSMSTWTQHAD